MTRNGTVVRGAYAAASGLVYVVLALTALGLCACSAGGQGDFAEPTIVEPTVTLAAVAEPAPIRITPRIVVPPELAMPGVAAVSLWEAATLDAYAPDLVAADLDDCTGADLCVRRVATRDFECSPGDDGFWWACFTGRVVVVWAEIPEAWQVSVLAHELGHSLGLEHADAGIMNPTRDRSRPCVEDADVAALEALTGIQGAPACVR